MNSNGHSSKDKTTMAKLYLEMKKFTDIHENQLQVNLQDPNEVGYLKLKTEAETKQPKVLEKKPSVPTYIRYQQQSALAALAAVTPTDAVTANEKLKAGGPKSKLAIDHISHL